MVIKAIDPIKYGNQGLINRRKIQLQIFSGALHFILKNHITRTSYTSFQPQMDICLHTDEVTSHKIFCGMILLNIAMTVMKPQLVINSRKKEKELKNLSLASCGENVRTLLTQM